MIDFHSHILPEIDDGAQSVEESIAMLRMLKEQGVDTVALTPHYIAMDESPAEFLERREKSFSLLKQEIEKSDEDFPNLLCGAEVYFFPGVCKMEELSHLRLQNTNLLLLEMPMAQWSDYVIRELCDLVNFSDTKIVIAHIERAIGYQKKGTLEKLLYNGVMIQVNASFFNMRKTRRKALKMFKNDEIHFIGSDCHSTKHRPPRIGEAVDILKEKFSDSDIELFFDRQKEYLDTNNI